MGRPRGTRPWACQWCLGAGDLPQVLGQGHGAGPGTPGPCAASRWGGTPAGLQAPLHATQFALLGDQGGRCLGAGLAMPTPRCDVLLVISLGAGKGLGCHPKAVRAGTGWGFWSTGRTGRVSWDEKEGDA